MPYTEKADRTMDDVAPEFRPAFAEFGSVLTVTAADNVDGEFSTQRLTFLPVVAIATVAVGRPICRHWPAAVVTMRDGSRVRCLADAAALAALLWRTAP